MWWIILLIDWCCTSSWQSYSATCKWIVHIFLWPRNRAMLRTVFRKKCMLLYFCYHVRWSTWWFFCHHGTVQIPRVNAVTMRDSSLGDDCDRRSDSHIHDTVCEPHMQSMTPYLLYDPHVHSIDPIYMMQTPYTQRSRCRFHAWPNRNRQGHWHF